MPADFWTSSHCTTWLFHDDVIAEVVRRDFRHPPIDTEIDVDTPVPCSTVSSAASDAPPSTADTDVEVVVDMVDDGDGKLGAASAASAAPLTPVEQYRLLNLYFVEVLNRLGERLALHQRVIATAAVLFKRFYMRKSLSEFDPRLVAPTLLFVAAKSENSAKSAKRVADTCRRVDSRFRFEARHIDLCEFYCQEALEFDFVVLHPYRVVSKFLCSLNLEQHLQTAWNIVNEAYYSDVVLRFPPYMVAIAAVYMTLVSLGEYDCSNWLESLGVSSVEIEEIVSEILTVSELRSKMDTSVAPDVERMLKHLDESFVAKQLKA